MEKRLEPVYIDDTPKPFQKDLVSAAFDWNVEASPYTCVSVLFSLQFDGIEV